MSDLWAHARPARWRRKRNMDELSFMGSKSLSEACANAICTYSTEGDSEITVHALGRTAARSLG